MSDYILFTNKSEKEMRNKSLELLVSKQIQVAIRDLWPVKCRKEFYAQHNFIIQIIN